MIKANVDVKEITAIVNGKEESFSEEKLMEIIQYYFRGEKVRTNSEIVSTPTEGKCFEVKFFSINQDKFKRKRKDPKQEELRQEILKAFTEVARNPERYALPFKTIIAEGMWQTPREFEFLKEYAKTMGDHNADWVEQSLEWAQRISNGESWKKLCNKRDTTKWYRLVEGPNGELWQVGGSAEKDIKEVSYSCTYRYELRPTLRYISMTAPLIVVY